MMLRYRPLVGLHKYRSVAGLPYLGRDYASHSTMASPTKDPINWNLLFDRTRASYPDRFRDNGWYLTTVNVIQRP
jgi:hypothetical protein